MNYPARALVVVAVTAPLASGCAWLVKYEVDQRFVRVETRTDELESRVTNLETSVTQTRDLAWAAWDRADVALGVVDKRLSPAARARVAVPSARSRALLTTVLVRFGFDRSDLDERAERALTAVLRELHDNPGLTVDLEGSTDPTGPRGYNVQLSLRRVDAVRRYLVTKGIAPARITVSSRVGPLPDGGVPDESKRRVAVKLMKS